MHSCGQYERELEILLHLNVMVLSNKQLELGTTQGELAKESKGFSWIMMLYVSHVTLRVNIFFPCRRGSFEMSFHLSPNCWMVFWINSHIRIPGTYCARSMIC